MSCYYYYPEVVGVDVQLLRVQLAQIRVCVLDVVHVLHSSVQTVHNLGAMGCDQWIKYDVLCAVQVAKGTKVPQAPGVHDQTPGKQILITMTFQRREWSDISLNTTSD